MAEKTEEKPISAEAMSVVESQASINYNTLADGGDILEDNSSEAKERRDREGRIYKDFALHPEFQNFLDRYNEKYEAEMKKLRVVDKDGLKEQQARVDAYEDVLRELSGYKREARKILTRNSH